MRTKRQTENKTLKRSGTLDLKKKIISGLLTAVIVFGLIPQNSVFAPLTAHATDYTTPIILKFAKGTTVGIQIGGVNEYGTVANVRYDWDVKIDNGPIRTMNGAAQQNIALEFSGLSNQEHIVEISPQNSRYGWARAFGNSSGGLSGNTLSWAGSTLIEVI